MVRITQGYSDNFFNLTVKKNLPGGNYFRMTFNSDFSNGNTLICLPTVVQTNSRYTQFQVDCSQANPQPLDGALNFYPLGNWTYTLDITETRSLTGVSTGILLTDMAVINSCGSTSNNIYNFITVNNTI